MKFFDETSGATLHMDRYYGFSDAGGLAGSFDGYPDQAAAIVAVFGTGVQMDEIGTDPEELGAVAVCILSGQQFVDRLKVVEPQGETFYGRWVE